jgi:hypothetical protein
MEKQVEKTSLYEKSNVANTLGLSSRSELLQLKNVQLRTASKIISLINCL